VKYIRSSYNLPKSIYDRYYLKSGQNFVLRRWKINRGDLEFVEGLANEIGVDPGHFHNDVSVNEAGWLAEVEKEHEEISVHIDKKALEDLLLATLETYLVPTARRRFTEVYGICMGSVRYVPQSKRNQGEQMLRYVYIERLAAQMRAVVTAVEAWPNERSLDAQLKTAGALFPHLEVVGDFHSHPFRTLEQLRKNRGWTFSDGDQIHSKFWANDLHERGHKPQIVLIAAIAKKGRARKPLVLPQTTPNMTQLTINNCAVTIAVYRILSDGSLTDHGITLTCPILLA